MTRSSLKAEPADVFREPMGERQVRLYQSDNRMRNFLECMRMRQDPICPVEVGHRSNSICVITHVAVKLGRKPSWDPQTERFIGDDAANAMLDYDHRKPWIV